MHKWDNYEVSKFDGIYSTSVYKGGFNNLVNITDQLKQHSDSEHVGEYGMEMEFLQLHEISEQVDFSGLVTVIENGPLHTNIFQWGNYPGDGWVLLGGIQGYA